MLESDAPSVFPDDLEIAEFWERYAELSTREQIREHGYITWACNTNKGVLFALTGWLLVVLLAGALFG